MVTKITERQIDNVVIVNFALRDSPIDVQLTVHINNLINCYGKIVIEEFKAKLNNPEDENCGGIAIKNIINHYGIEIVKEWFVLIYGWKFKKAG